MLPVKPEGVMDRWCALIAGNSRLHWAMFLGETLQQTWDCSYAKDAAPFQQPDWERHSPALAKIAPSTGPMPPLWMLSVVPSQTAFWQAYPNLHSVTLADIPLGNVYPSLGCDRALALWSAGQRYGFPALVIDGGTALTLTGADANGNLVGGAILPGVGLQLRSLSAAASLPTPSLTESLPPRWARNTTGAIASGVLYTLRAGLFDFLQHWCQDVAVGTIVIAGGDASLLYQNLQSACNEKETIAPVPWQNRLICDETLLFQGIRRLRIKSLESQGSELSIESMGRLGDGHG